MCPQRWIKLKENLDPKGIGAHEAAGTSALNKKRNFSNHGPTRLNGGGVLVVPRIRASFKELVGCPVIALTAYRILARNGWRKVAPDTCHPKRNVQAQEDFKKIP